MRQIYCLVILFVSTFSIHLPGADLKLQSLDNFHPYIWQSDEGLDGIDMSMIKELEKRTGSKLEVELTPWKRLLQNIKDGSVDGEVSGFVTEERESYAFFSSHPLHVSTVAIFVHVDRSFPVEKLSDLRGKRIGYPRGWSAGKKFDTAVEDGWFELVEGTDLKTLSHMLVLGRIDALVGNLDSSRYILREIEDGDKVAALPFSFGPPKPSYLMLSKASPRVTPELRRRIDDALAAIHDDGTFDAIVKRYTKPLVQPDQE